MDPKPASEFAPMREGLWAGLDEEIYHNHKAAPEVNRGLIVEMVTETPEHVKASIDGLRVKKITEAMQIGLLVDKALLEPDRFKEGVSHWVVPDGMKLSTKEGIAWKKDHLGPDEGGLPRLKSDAAKDISGMIEKIMKHKQARAMVELAVKQESAFAFDKDTGLLRKCRSDMRLSDLDGRIVVGDLKSTMPGGATSGIWSSHCARRGYHIQSVFYSDIYNDLFNGANPAFLFLVVERKPPYSVRVFQIDMEGRTAAREKCKRALEMFAKCKASGVWPGYREEIETIKLPSWELSPTEDVVDLQ